MDEGDDLGLNKCPKYNHLRARVPLSVWPRTPQTASVRPIPLFDSLTADFLLFHPLSAISFSIDALSLSLPPSCRYNVIFKFLLRVKMVRLQLEECHVSTMRHCKPSCTGWHTAAGSSTEGAAAASSDSQEQRQQQKSRRKESLQLMLIVQQALHIVSTLQQYFHVSSGGQDSLR